MNKKYTKRQVYAKDDSGKYVAQPEYHVFLAMIGRCHLKNNKQYPQYGLRGISVCERWRNSFDNFIADMGNRPSDKHTLDRIDVNGNYEPGNCRWTTMFVQQNNRTNNRKVIFEGEELTISELAAKIGFSRYTVSNRYYRGWSIDRLVSTPETKQKY